MLSSNFYTKAFNEKLFQTSTFCERFLDFFDASTSYVPSSVQFQEKCAF